MDPIITINLINAIHRHPNDPEQETNKLKRFKQLTKGV